MEKDFDFEMIGRKMPYTAPEGFFDDVELKVSERIHRRRKARRIRMVVATIFAAAAMFIGIIMLPTGESAVDTQQPAKAIACQTRQTDSDKVTIDNRETAVQQIMPAETNKTSGRQAEKSIPKPVEKEISTKNKDDEWIKHLSDDDLESLSTMSDNDVFMTLLD
jgi:hypothetical protein